MIHLHADVTPAEIRARTAAGALNATFSLLNFQGFIEAAQLKLSQVGPPPQLCCVELLPVAQQYALARMLLAAAARGVSAHLYCLDTKPLCALLKAAIASEGDVKAP